MNIQMNQPHGIGIHDNRWQKKLVNIFNFKGLKSFKSCKFK